MQTRRCSGGVETIHEGSKVAHDEAGLTYHYMCRPASSSTVRPPGSSGGSGRDTVVAGRGVATGGLLTLLGGLFLLAGLWYLYNPSADTFNSLTGSGGDVVNL